MKEKLIKLAKEKGFKSKVELLMSAISYQPEIIERYINEMEYYLFMCELQKWLRDNHSFHVIVEPIVRTIEKDLTFRYYGLRFEKSYADITEKGFKLYKEALEKGLYEALKLIK